MRKELFTNIISSLFIILFVYAASSKLLDYDNFRIQLSQSPILGSVPNLISWLVPTIEITIAVMLFSSKFRLAGLYGSFTLMIVFTGYIIGITNYSEYIPCSCGGILSKMNWNQHLVFNIVFVMIAGAGILLWPIQPRSPKIFFS